MKKETKQQFIFFTLIFLAAFFIFLPGLKGDFIWDDIHQVKNNSYLDHWSNFWKILTSSVWEVTDFGKNNATLPVYRVTMMESYLILTQFFGKNPFFFHIVGFFVHLTNGWLFFQILKRFGISLIACAIATSLFLIHPMTAEAVIWIGSLQDTYSLLFSLLIFFLILEYKDFRWRHWTALTILFLLAFVTKEVCLAIGLPVLTLVIYLKEKKIIESQKCYGIFIVYFLTVGIYWLIRHLIFGPMTMPGQHVSFSWLGHVVIFFFLSLKLYLLPLVPKICRPYTLKDFSLIDYMIPLSAITYIFYSCRNKIFGDKKWIIFFGLTLAIYPLVPVIFSVLENNVFAERYIYIPVAGFCVILSVYLNHLFAIQSKSLIRINTVIFFSLLLAYASISHGYSKKWIDDHTIFMNTLNHPPYNQQVPYHLGVSAVENKDYAAAIAYFEESIRLDGSKPQAINNLGTAKLNSGQTVQAIKIFEELVKFYPDVAKYHYNLALSYYTNDEKSKAKVELQICLTMDPTYPRGLALLQKLNDQ